MLHFIRTPIRAVATLSLISTLGVSAACRPSPSGDAGDNKALFSLGGMEKQPKARAKQPEAAPRPYVAPSIPLGVNLGSVTYYSTAIPFVDVMKMADPFLSTNAPTASKSIWDTEVADKIPRDENGYALELPTRVQGVPEPQILRASVVATMYGGRYTVLYEGDGEISFPSSPANVINRSPGRIDVEIEATRERPLFLAIERSNRSTHVRHIRVLLPAYESTYAKQVFHPSFLGKLHGVGVLRFMDWGSINGSTLTRWSDRTTPGMNQGGSRGVAFEYMIDLANRLGADPWFCLPHKADDQFVEELAKLIKARLSPQRRAYIEYSNELWNGIFEQSKYVSEQGCRAGLNKRGRYAGSCDDDGSRYWAGVKYNARRSGQIFQIFDKVFAGELQRLTHVLAGQAQNEHLNEVLLESFADEAINTARTRAELLAIAPYIGGSVASNVAEEGKAASITVPQLLDRMDGLLESEVTVPTRNNRKIAEKHGMRLVAYEGGQHLVAYGEASKDEAFVNKLIAANRHPRMRSLYTRMLDAWYAQSDNGLFLAYNFAETPTKYGVWGLLETQEQPMGEAPKYQAFFDRLQRLAARQAESAPPPAAATKPAAATPAATQPTPAPQPASKP